MSSRCGLGLGAHQPISKHIRPVTAPALTHRYLGSALHGPHGSPTDPYLSPGPWRPVLVVPVWVWDVRELVRLWRTRVPGMPVLGLLLAERYRLSTAAMMMGLSNGVVYALHGPWAYTSAIRFEDGRLAGREFHALGLLGASVALMCARSSYPPTERPSMKI